MLRMIMLIIQVEMNYGQNFNCPAEFNKSGEFVKLTGLKPNPLV